MLEKNGLSGRAAAAAEKQGGVQVRHVMATVRIVFDWDEVWIGSVLSLLQIRLFLDASATDIISTGPQSLSSECDEDTKRGGCENDGRPKDGEYQEETWFQPLVPLLRCRAALHRLEVRYTFHIVLLLVEGCIINYRRVAGAFCIFRVEIKFYRAAWVNVGHLKYWHFVGDLRLEFHFLSVIELKEEVGRQAAVKSFLTLDFEGGEGLVDNLAGSEGGGLPRWHNLEHASLLLPPNRILPDAEKAPVVL